VKLTYKKLKHEPIKAEVYATANPSGNPYMNPQINNIDPYL